MTTKKNEKVKKAEKVKRPEKVKKVLEVQKMSLTGQICPDDLSDFVATFKQLDEEGPVQIWLNSEGGETTTGFAIYEVIRTSKHPVEIVCYGLAGSIAALIFEAADHRIMTEGAMMMFHDFSLEGGGSLESVKSYVSESVRAKAHYCQQIAKRSGLKLDVVKKLTSKEYFLTADDCIRYNFVDTIIGHRPFPPLSCRKAE